MGDWPKHIKMKYLLIALSFLFINCTRISKYDLNLQDNLHLKADNIGALNGIYYNSPKTQDSLLSYQTVSHILNWRELRKGQNDSVFSKVKLNVVDSKRINVLFLDQSGEKLYSKQIKYKIKKNGFVFLKNRNFRLVGIPFVFGEYDVNQFELGISSDNNLIINGFTKEVGGVLIVLSSGWGYSITQEYKKM